jgi:hypothetical protein
MNKQMTPAEIELFQQAFTRLAFGVESGPKAPSNVPAAFALASVTMK